METTAWDNSTNCSCTGVSGEWFSCSSAAVEKGLSKNGPLKQFSYGLCLTWACHKHHQFLQMFFLSSPLDVWIHWRCLPPSLAFCQRSGCHMNDWCTGVLFIHSWECVTYSICHRWSSNLWFAKSFKDMTRLLLWALMSYEHQDTFWWFHFALIYECESPWH